MEDLLLLIMVLHEKSEIDIINLFKYKVGYYILYPALLHNRIVVLVFFRTSERPLNILKKIIKLLLLLFHETKYYPFFMNKRANLITTRANISQT